MTHRPAQLRSPVALLTSCALLLAALAGVVALSGRAHAATELGKFTVAPATGSITDIPMTTSVTTSAGCNSTTAQTTVLRLVNPTTPTALLPLAQSVTKAGVGADPFTVALTATAAKPSLQSALTSAGVSAPYDGTYTLALMCTTSTTADRFLAKIRVAGDTWTLLEQQATTLAVSAAADVPVGGDLKLTATVSPAAAAGSVEFKNGDTSLGTATATNGTAELTVKAPAIGGPLPFGAVFTPTDADAYSSASATGSATIDYVVTAKDADGKDLTADPTLAIGQKIKVTVKGFTPAAAAHVTLSGSTATYPDVTVTADGTVADYAFTVPDQLPNGDHALQFSEKTGIYASLPFVSTDAATSSPSPTATDNPDLTVTDEDGTALGTNPALDPGQKVKITARGYTASATVKVTLADSTATFTDAKANSAGTVDSYEFTVPSDIADGDHTLTLAEDATAAHSVTFPFTTGGDDSSESPSPTPSDSDSGTTPTDGADSGGSDTGGTTGGDSGTGSASGSMAATGTQIGAIGLASLAFLAAGSALVLHMRRRGLLTFGHGDTPQHR
ncbi:hypothetical protein [Streptomyces sp. MBT62]|uniref:hypothetical protein n=1 Tax=Streptomyces sp. MBT62 TaxID=2800410 RepID=UPI00190C7C01|nr:hypothetical protein [Streptomyces sp. MBT62]MBK3571814.1 hypothetical protein [Streptomyces sp. MBT62]